MAKPAAAPAIEPSELPEDSEEMFNVRRNSIDVGAPCSFRVCRLKTSTGAESLYARQRVVNAAHATGVQAIDSVFGDVGDMDGLRAWGLNSRAVGFEGMGCVHPTQIPVIHEAFAPSAFEIERARKIVIAYDEAQEKGLGVVSIGSKMIDPPVVQRAVKLMARARTMGLVP